MMLSCPNATELTCCVVISSPSIDAPIFELSRVVIQGLITGRLLAVIGTNEVVSRSARSHKGSGAKQDYPAHISSPGFERLYFRHNPGVSVH